MTMTFVVMGLGTIFNAITNRRGPSSGLTPPVLKAVMIGLVPAGLFVLPLSCRSCSPPCAPRP